MKTYTEQQIRDAVKFALERVMLTSDEESTAISNAFLKRTEGIEEKEDPQIMKNLPHINEATLKLEKLKHPARRIDIAVILEELLVAVHKGAYKGLNPDKTRKQRYSIRTKLVDNITGKDAELYMDSDVPEKLGDSLNKFVQAACGLINLEDADLKEVQKNLETTLSLTKVYHAKKPNFGFGDEQKFNDENFELVAEMEGNDIEMAFSATQNLDEAWFLNKNIKAFKTPCRSTSVGDIVTTQLHKNDVKIYRCENIGWVEIKK